MYFKDPVLTQQVTSNSYFKVIPAGALNLPRNPEIRKHQFVFLNGRPVEDHTISRAIREAFKGGLQEGLQPAAWLWILMDPALVDVNVHPAKREVRFAEPAQVRIAILDAIEEALRPKEVVAPGISVQQRPPLELGENEETQQVVTEDEVEPVKSSPPENKIAWRHE